MTTSLWRYAKEYIIDGFVNNNREFQVSFDNEIDAREEFEKRKVNCVEVNFYCNDGGRLNQLDSFNKPFSEG